MTKPHRTLSRLCRGDSPPAEGILANTRILNYIDKKEGGQYILCFSPNLRRLFSPSFPLIPLIIWNYYQSIWFCTIHLVTVTSDLYVIFLGCIC